MGTLDQAVQTQLDNIQKKTGKTLVELAEIIQRSGLTRHGEIREFLQRELGLGYGDANTLVHIVRQSDGASAAEGKTREELLDGNLPRGESPPAPHPRGSNARGGSWVSLRLPPKKGT